MKTLIELALRWRVFVLAVAVVLIVMGIDAARRAPLDVFPEFAPPQVEIQTEAPGLSTEQVENLVTTPLENSLTGVPWLATIRSKSVLGLSSIVLIFKTDVDLNDARQLVQERVGVAAASLPELAKRPVIMPPVSSTSRILKIGLASQKLSQTELSEMARWTIRPRLMSVPGVANVAIWGERARQLQVLVDPDRLRAHEVSLEQVMESARQAVRLSGGGFIDTPNQRMAVLHVPAVHNAADLARVPVVFRDGSSLTLGQVADVVEGYALPIGDAVVNDGPGLLLIVEKQPWGNTLDVTHGVEKALDALRPGLTDIQLDATIFRPATFIELSLDSLSETLMISALLVSVVLLAFLAEWRTALVSIVAIPLSLLGAVLIIIRMGGTVNTMVLAGLVIALGEVVDDAIIDVENIVRRLRLNEQAERPLSAFRVVLDASFEVRGAVVFGSLLVVLVVIPLFLLEGVSGAFFRPLATSYILAMLASLAVALTVTPALAYLLLGRRTGQSETGRLSRGLVRAYAAMLPVTLNHPRATALVLMFVVALAAAAVPFMGEDFLPDFREYDFVMHWVEKPGTSLAAVQRVTENVSRELRSIPGVRNFGAHIGRAEIADEVVGPNFAELWISLDPAVDYGPTIARIQQVVDGYPGLQRDVLTYLKERIKEVLTGASATIVVRLYGPDLEVLRTRAADVMKVMQEVPGVADLKVEPQVLVPQVEVAYRPEAAQQFGLTPGQVRQAAATLVSGERVGEIFEDQRSFEVVVWGVPELRQSVEALRSIRIGTPSGALVPLGDVADVRIDAMPNMISRENASRRLDITCNVRGRDLAGVAREVEANVRGLSFDRGYYPEFLGEYAAQAQSRNRLLAAGVLSLVGMLVLLEVEFASFRLAFLVFLSLPFALAGGVAAVFASGGSLSLGALIGFITVLGVAARNGIMLVSHYRHLQFEEGLPFGWQTVLQGSRERLVPILMTALTTALALIPVLARGDKPGHEIEYPMAAVILGGLASSTLLNLVGTPALYLLFGRRAPAPAQT